MNKNCGIYKITSPSGRIYIGQAIDISRRLKGYKAFYGSVKDQPALYNSFKKHGVENHQFDIIEYCSEDQLNCSERFWQDEFDVLNGGLNCVLTQCGEKRRIISQQTREAFSRRSRGSKNPMWGKHHSHTTKKILSEMFEGSKSPVAKKLIDINGNIYDCIKFASESLEIPYYKITDCLRGKNKNTVGLMYLEDYNKGLSFSDYYKVEFSYKKLIDIETTIVYTYNEASEMLNIPLSTLSIWMNNPAKNKTNLVLKDDYDTGRYIEFSIYQKKSYSSIYMYVSGKGQSWKASAPRSQHTRIHIGSYKTELEAAEAVRAYLGLDKLLIR